MTLNDLETMYPFELYSSPNDGNAWVGSEAKRRYLDVCKTRPHPPIYFNRTPIKNISSSTIDFSDTSTFTMSGTEEPILAYNESTETADIDPPDLAAGAITRENIPLDFIERTEEKTKV